MESVDLVEKVILEEIAGKNAAIHAYDSITWKIRSGFLTLLFAGWALLLQKLAEDASVSSQAMKLLVGRLAGHSSISDRRMMVLVIGMMLVSLGLTVAGMFIDFNYLRHKFRVILSLDQLTEAVSKASGDYKTVPIHLLRVAGDNGDYPYKCKGYKQSLWIGFCVYAVPFATLVVSGTLLLVV